MDTRSRGGNSFKCLSPFSKSVYSSGKDLIPWELIFSLTVSSLQLNTDTLANSADRDETARSNEPSHQDLHCLSFYG